MRISSIDDLETRPAAQLIVKARGALARLADNIAPGATMRPASPSNQPST